MSNNEHKGVWILAEQAGGRLQRVSYELLTRGRALADKLQRPLTAVVFGAKISEQQLQELINRGADGVLVMEAAELEHFLVEPYAACMLKLLTEFGACQDAASYDEHCNEPLCPYCALDRVASARKAGQ